MSRSKAISILLLLSFTVASGAFAQDQANPAQQPTPAPQASRGPDYVEFTGFKGKVFDVKYRDPNSLVTALRPLGSGFKGATISYSEEFKTLSVRDFPENIAAIEEALKRLDTPQPPQSDVELRVHVLIASNVEGVVSVFPADLGDVVKQLQATLSYKNYSNIATVVQRVKAGSRNIGVHGFAEVPAAILGTERGQTSSYDFRARSMSLASESSTIYTVRLEEAGFTFRGGPQNPGDADIRTDLSLRNGEKVVVGTATLGNKGLILVLSAKMIK